MIFLLNPNIHDLPKTNLILTFLFYHPSKNIPIRSLWDHGMISSQKGD